MRQPEHGEEAARLAAIVSSSDDAIISKTLDGIITSWNAGAERIFGYGAEEMIGASIIKIIPTDLLSEEAHIIAQLRQGNRVEHFETVRIGKDGRRLELSITVSPMRDAQGRSHRRLQSGARHLRPQTRPTSAAPADRRA